MRDLVGAGASEAWRTGPRLADAAYPDVLVARAVTDGADLDLVLLPGDGPTRADLVLDRLVPGRSYRVTGARTDTVLADATGRATVQVDLGDRTRVRVVPTW